MRNEPSRKRSLVRTHAQKKSATKKEPQTEERDDFVFFILLSEAKSTKTFLLNTQELFQEFAFV